MFLHRRGNRVLVALLLMIPVTFSLVSMAAPLAQQLGIIKPNLGKPVPEGFDSVINIDGTGLPVGKGSVLQGKSIYDLRCAACHGIDGKQRGNELVGGRGTLATMQPVRTVGSYWPYATTLFDYIARAMPYNQEKSLSIDDIYAISAYVLFLNGIVKENAILDKKNLPDIVMPNRNGFIEVSSP